jgi:hypothetical protein
MAQYKVIPEEHKAKPVEEWGTAELIEYFREKHKEVMRVKSHKPEGLLKIHINSKNVRFLYEQGKEDFGNIPASQLYKEYMDWLFEYKRGKDGLIRLWSFSNKDMMTDFLDYKSMAVQEKALGSLDDFKKEEEERKQRAKAYFERDRGGEVK